MFAREGFHACRVSDIANEAGVAYGLVYHYFKSKDQVLDTLFLERWDFLLEAIRETDRQDVPAEQKLTAIAGFIIESYRHDPDLMKVIIVEVTRAANTFGATHIGKIGEAYALIRGVVEKAQKTGEFRSEIPAEFAVMAFYGAIEQVLTGWIFGLLPRARRVRAGQGRTSCGPSSAASPHRLRAHDRQRSRQAPGLVRPARRHRCPGLDRDHPNCSCGFPPHLWGRSARVKDEDPQRTQEWDPSFEDEQVAPPGTPAEQAEAAAGATAGEATKAAEAREAAAQAERADAEARGAELRKELRETDARRAEEETAKAHKGVEEAEEQGGEALAQGAQGAREGRAGRRGGRARPRAGRGRRAPGRQVGAAEADGQPLRRQRDVARPGLGHRSRGRRRGGVLLHAAAPEPPSSRARSSGRRSQAGIAFASAFLIARILKRLVD